MMTAGRCGRLALALAAAATLAACAPAGGAGGTGPGGMGGGRGSDMAGGMGSGMAGSGGAAAGGSAPAGGDEHDGVEGPEEIPGARVVAVEAGDVYFRPDTIRVRAGEPVNITVTNVGNAFHDFTVTDLGVMIDVPAGTTATGGLTVYEPGEYAYECTVPGHAAAGMTGTLVITE